MADLGAELIALLLVGAAIASLAYAEFGWVGVSWVLAGYAAAVLALALWLALART